MNWLRLTVSRNLKDQFEQNWHLLLEESPKAVNYKVFKDSFSSEAYLDILDNKNLVEFCRFRTTNHKLPIEAGRWLNTSRQNRNCTLCKNNELFFGMPIFLKGEEKLHRKV